MSSEQLDLNLETKRKRTHKELSDSIQGKRVRYGLNVKLDDEELAFIQSERETNDDQPNYRN